MTPKSLTLSDLLRHCRCLTAISSLNHSRPVKTQPQPSDHSFLTLNPSPNFKTLESLNQSIIISGTLILPSPADSPHPFSFLFTDETDTVPCDVLDFELGMIGVKIEVTAWNFVPFELGKGFLEIIRWKFQNLGLGLSNLNVGNVNSSVNDVKARFPLNLKVLSLNLGNLDSSVDDVKARYCVQGILESVSPVSIVPCSTGPDRKDSRNICGFLVNVLVCECRSCKKNELVTGSDKDHNFVSPVIVYFCGNYAASWHPVIVKVAGSVVVLAKLKKKMVYIGEKQSQLMYVTTESSSISVAKLLGKCGRSSKSMVKGKGDCGSYSGIVTAIHMKGMIVELDQKVLLVVTDQQLVLPHGVRVGAMVSIRNVHFVNPKFSWRKMLILGACFKTSICLELFSPFETGCCMYDRSQSLQGKFIDSLEYSARLWVLLLVSSFAKKFDGILSEHEILGSKHKKGLVQSYAASKLPSSVFQSRHGLFIEYCKHDSSCCSKEPSNLQLKLVVPIADFIKDCNTTWMKMFLDSDVTYGGGQKGGLFCEGAHYNQPFRRVLGSNEIGVALLGQAKICQSTGRLQMVDATGSVDVIATDLPSTWGINGIYEVNDFTLVMEGVAKQDNRMEILTNETFSCLAAGPHERAVNVAMYLLYHFRDQKLLNHPSNSTVKDNTTCEIQSGSFHMLLVTHKYPLNQKFLGERDIANNSSKFAEVFFLPWEINFLAKDDYRNPTKLSTEIPKESVRAYSSGIHEDFVRSKRLKTDKGSGDERHTIAVSYELQGCTGLRSSLGIQCPVTYKDINNQLLSGSATICGFHSDVKASSGRKSRGQKLLLEFKSESFYKYQLLSVGGYYLIKHRKEDGLCANNTICHAKRSKIIISDIPMWKSSFSSNQVCPDDNVCDLPGPVDLTDEKIAKCHLNDKLPFPSIKCKLPQTQSDVTFHLSNDNLEFLKDNLTRLDESLVKPFVSPEEFSNFSWPNEMTGLVKSPVHSESHYKLPEGNLISLRGKVLSVHNFVCNANSSLRSDFRRGKIFAAATSVCIHILVDHHPVRILNSSSNYIYPVGFGPGCSADFHRILVLRGQNTLVMTPSSYIAIKSISLTTVEKCYNSNVPLFPSDLLGDASLDTVPTVLISEVGLPVDCKPVQLHCRMVAICILLMEKNCQPAPSQTSCSTNSTVFQIPFAGFILDDGSSTACFWAKHEKALTLLKLKKPVSHEIARNSVELEKIEGKINCNTIIHRLDKILKKHGFVTVRNYGSMYDSTGQDLTLSFTSNTIINDLDEEVLRRLILNACISTSWSVVGSLMDSHDVAKLEKQLAEMDMTMPPMRNIWVHDVHSIDPLAEARRLMLDFQIQ